MMLSYKLAANITYNISIFFPGLLVNTVIQKMVKVMMHTHRKAIQPTQQEDKKVSML